MKFTWRFVFYCDYGCTAVRDEEQGEMSRRAVMMLNCSCRGLRHAGREQGWCASWYWVQGLYGYEVTLEPKYISFFDL